MNPVMDRAIGEFFRRVYRMPDGLTAAQFKQGVRRIYAVQLVGVIFWLGFVWFAEQMRMLAG